MEVKALSAMKKGEEVFMSYLGMPHTLFGWRERHEVLAAWFSGPCECERCLVEQAREAVAARRARAR